MADKKKITIAIDGPASSGKSTVAKLLAKRLGYLYVDTGAMYRTVTLAARLQGVEPSDSQSLVRLSREARLDLKPEAGEVKVYLEGVEVGHEIRTPEISRLTSQFTANVPGVRESLVARQREFGRQGGVVMEGRDISTVVFPAAELKVFLSASVTERARRRILDFEKRGIPCDASKVEEEIRLRDEEDRRRPVGALLQAPDAVAIVADGKSPESIVQEILGHWPVSRL
jgi:cytidylate kinase